MTLPLLRWDYERKNGTLEPLEALDASGRSFRSAASQLLQDARQVIERVGPLQELGHAARANRKRDRSSHPTLRC